MKHYFWAILWGFIVLFLIVTPIQVEETSFSTLLFPGIDKLVHTFIFFVFTVLLFFGLLKENRPFQFFNLKVVGLLFTASFFAIATEFIQEYLTTYRTFEIFDIFADHVGIGMGYFAYLAFLLATKKGK